MSEQQEFDKSVVPGKHYISSKKPCNRCGKMITWGVRIQTKGGSWLPAHINDDGFVLKDGSCSESKVPVYTATPQPPKPAVLAKAIGNARTSLLKIMLALQQTIIACDYMLAEWNSTCLDDEARHLADYWNAWPDHERCAYLAARLAEETKSGTVASIIDEARQVTTGAMAGTTLIDVLLDKCVGAGIYLPIEITKREG